MTRGAVRLIFWQRLKVGPEQDYAALDDLLTCMPKGRDEARRTTGRKWNLPQ